MRTEHLDFITFYVGSLSDALHKSASQVYGDLRSSGVRDKLDFGKGFYLTAIREQAVRLKMPCPSSMILTLINSSVRAWPICIAAATSIWLKS